MSLGSEILPSNGVEFCDFPLRTDLDLDLDLVSFNDLSIVEGWTDALRVEAIKEIVLYVEKDLVVGIELVYLLRDNNPGPPRIINSPRITHGKKTKDYTKIVVAAEERMIAAFVGVADNKIKSLRFTKTNPKDGTVKTDGYPPGSAAVQDCKSYAAFGEISAFRGTKIRGDEGRLVTLGVQTRYLGVPVKTST
ncbi:hypothetical protein OG21DRAFT_1507233 [Imleria badia]|nr:hypothetical protein OG21DRAFT_1507233 [Imleria badia]